ncbi:MAG: hypothetical protein ACI8RD_004163 [Bacillariaceae sp.]|jgi:hypothetical protein
MKLQLIQLIALISLLSGVVHSFCSSSTSTSSSRPSTAIFDGDGTGGWGIGGQRTITPEEFAKGDRRYFESYKMSEQSDFMIQIDQDKEDMEKSQLEELLGVAKIAGLSVKDPKGRLNKFDLDILQDDDDDLDLTV